MNINPKVINQEISLIRQISIKSKQYKDVIDLTIGEPDLPIPCEIVDQTTLYMKNNRMGYPMLGGTPEIREEIVKFYNTKYDSSYKIDEVLVTAGASEAISTTMRTILNEGDEVLIPLPSYPGYLPNIDFNGGKSIFIDTISDKLQLTVENLKKHITPKTKALILNYPNNPSGIILSKKNLDEIMDFLRDKDIYIISDEIYSEITFDDDFISVGKYDFLKEKIILINGFSKSHSMTGWRLGYILTSKKLRDQLIKVHQYTLTSPSIVSQYGGYVALSKCSDISSYTKKYKKRCEYVYNRLNSMGIVTLKPKGTFYIFGSLNNFNIDSSLDFALDLLENKHIAIVPGIVFGVEGYFRISCTKSVEILKLAMDKIENYIEKYKS
ncbi:aminotransferase class I/II-fold pyridoxal phosphate-dependent enzyme [Psychrilyobacter sp.]|uniref:pyridoxal phosphate-dependent aminotransferase n=1 Tax=Psychrilyobacter sp. TaxID=2586924 RepID=UPI003015BF7A